MARVNPAQAGHRVAGCDGGEPGAEHHVLLQADRRMQPGLLDRDKQASGRQHGRQQLPARFAAGGEYRTEHGEHHDQACPHIRALQNGCHRDVRLRPGQGARRDAQPVVAAASDDGRDGQREPRGKHGQASGEPGSPAVPPPDGESRDERALPE